MRNVAKTEKRTTTTGPVVSARREVESSRVKLAELQQVRAAAESELESLQGRAGTMVLDDPSAGDGVARDMQRLRDQVDITGRAIAAQEERVRAAEVRFLLGEAERVDVGVEEARAALAAHQSRTEDLLQQLEAHEGKFVPEVDLIHERRRAVANPLMEWDLPKSHLLEDLVLEAELPGRILREMAEGRDPHTLVTQTALAPAEVYPACVWGPDALVPAPAYVRTVEQRCAEFATAVNAVANLERDVEAREVELEVARQEGDRRQLQLPKWDESPTAASRVQAARENLTTAVERREALRLEVVALTGVDSEESAPSDEMAAAAS